MTPKELTDKLRNIVDQTSVVWQAAAVIDYQSRRIAELENPAGAPPRKYTVEYKKLHWRLGREDKRKTRLASGKYIMHLFHAHGFMQFAYYIDKMPNRRIVLFEYDYSKPEHQQLRKEISFDSLEEAKARAEMYNQDHIYAYVKDWVMYID